MEAHTRALYDAEPSGEFKDGWEITRQLFGRMKARTDQLGVPLAVFVIPDSPQLRGCLARDGGRARLRQGRAGLTSPNQQLAAIAGRYGLPCSTCSRRSSARVRRRPASLLLPDRPALEPRCPRPGRARGGAVPRQQRAHPGGRLRARVSSALSRCVHAARPRPGARAGAARRLGDGSAAVSPRPGPGERLALTLALLPALLGLAAFAGLLLGRPGPLLPAVFCVLLAALGAALKPRSHGVPG